MKWFYISTFTINVLSVAILLFFMIFYLCRNKDKTKSTKHLIIFLLGVEIVFISFCFIFSSLDQKISFIFWWMLHIVVFSSVSMLQFAYNFPDNIHLKESKIVFIVTITAAIIVYPVYIFHTTLSEPQFIFDGKFFVVLDTPEIGVVIGLELVIMLSLFLRKSFHYADVSIKKDGLFYSIKEIFKTNNPNVKATRNLFIIFTSPVALVVVIIMAYLGILSFEIVGHLFGSALMIAAFFFVIQYINYSEEPSTFMLKLVGISLGTLLIFMGFIANAALTMKDMAYKNECLLKVEICKNHIKGNQTAIPSNVSYILEGTIVVDEITNYKILYTKESKLNGLKFRRLNLKGWYEGKRSYRKLSKLNPDFYYLHYDFREKQKIYEVGFKYRDYRLYIHETGKLLVIIIVTSVFFLVIVFPYFFKESLIKPLNHLLDGVGKVNRGDLDIVVPVKVNDEIGYLSFSFNKMVKSVLESETKLKGSLDLQVRLTDAYTRFVPKEFLDFLDKETVIEISLGDYVKTEMTIIFSDIREFTNLSEKMTPHENFEFINSYLKVVGPVVRKHRGFIDKYIGDAVMALFPVSPFDAIKASVEMQETIRKHNKKWVEKGLDPIKFGVGIHTGEMMLGTIGEEKRMEGTVISDAVNLASRMERLTKLYGVSIIVSDSALSGNKEQYEFNRRYLDRVKVKGKSKWVDIYEVFDCDSKEQIALKVKSLSSFTKGITSYQRKDIKEALIYFKKVVEINPLDNPAKLYIERCEHYLKYGVPDGFRGVTELDEKKF
ncbi:MAG: HAMP domain-containing protein [Desulfobacterales bacterium]|nr:HAMP domain-containing protein [Desulfobacterales bacterium]MCP4162065.1 HAMP domain-containing protein [Deltaproteobacteria bacterium]